MASPSQQNGEKIGKKPGKVLLFSIKMGKRWITTDRGFCFHVTWEGGGVDEECHLDNLESQVLKSLEIPKNAEELIFC